MTRKEKGMSKKRKLFMLSLGAAMLLSVATSPVLANGVNYEQVAEASNVKMKTFKDVSKTYVYHNEIVEMGGKGIIHGYPDGTFKPNTKIIRRHAAALISRAKGDTLPVKDKLVQFKDIPKTDRGYNEIRKLQQAGLFTADKNGNFKPNQELTRAEMARILVVSFNLKVKANYDFADVPSSHAYSEDIRALYSNGITTGDNGKFLPNEGLSRAHYAVFMYRAMNMDKNYVPQPIPKPTPPVVKPTPTPPVVKPTPKPPVVTPPVVKPPTGGTPPGHSGWVNPVKYHDVEPSAVKRPAGYVAGKHETNSAAILEGLMAKNKHNFKSGINLRSSALSDTTRELMLNNDAKIFGITKAEYVKILDWAIETGQVYDGGSFAVYYNYGSGTFGLSGTHKR